MVKGGGLGGGVCVCVCVSDGKVRNIILLIKIEFGMFVKGRGGGGGGLGGGERWEQEFGGKKGLTPFKKTHFFSLFFPLLKLWETPLFPPPPPPRLQKLPYFNTIARPLHNIRPPTDPLFACHTPYNNGDGNIVLRPTPPLGFRLRSCLRRLRLPHRH